ncbi:MAG TPA: CSLREA domain-containing protein [Candidatus Dormibacteraeota bacterium]|nr:CSLREA domain-containing protein [Candidatus Dormibacteraeota bacterium]
MRRGRPRVRASTVAMAMIVAGLGMARAQAGAPALVVNTTADVDDTVCDPQHCSLREAINAANAQAGPDVIRFAIPSADPGCDASGVCTVQPASLLPILSDDGTTIDGFTQPGAAPGDEPILKIVLDGHDNGGFSGLGVHSADNVVRGLVIQRFTPFSGIQVFGTTASGNRINGNFIGTDASGTQPRGNCSPPVSCAAVWLSDGAHDNTIGPDNLIAFNGQGVWVTDTATRGNTITRNRIHGNANSGIRLYQGNDALPAPEILTVGGDRVAGTACAGCTVEVFSDVEDEGALFEGSVVADSAGGWLFTSASGLDGPHVTATATDAVGNTSAFSAPVASGCAGDCNGDGQVTIEELIKLVGISLGEAEVAICPAGDSDGNLQVAVNEIVTAVNHALSGCPSP